MNRIKYILLCLAMLIAGPRVSAQIAAVELSKGEAADVDNIVIVFKMHFDIGYTDWAEAILQKYSGSMMEQVSESVKATRELPRAEQFVWTVPSLPAKYMLENASPELKSQIERMLREGHLKVHSLPFTYQTEASDLEMLTRGMGYASDICKAYGQSVPRDAKLTDVPSHSWVLPTLLSNAGVKILHIGCNPGSVSPDVPTLFWWEGPDGSRLLTFNWAEYYGSGVKPPKGWPHKTWLAMIHTHENTGAPTPAEVETVIREAREAFPNANIRIGQLADFYDALMAEKPTLPVVRGDMPDTWIHGYMSYPREMKLNKHLQRNIFATEALASLSPMWGLQREEIGKYVDAAVEKSIMFDEHTFGLAVSHGQQAPWRYGRQFETQHSLGNYDYIEKAWIEKASRVYDAERQIVPPMNRQMAALAAAVATEGRRVVVYNSQPWRRSGMVALHTNIYILDNPKQVTALRDCSTGEIIKADSRNNQLIFNAVDVPAMGYKTYAVVTDAESAPGSVTKVDRQAAVVESDIFRMTLDTVRGTLRSLVDKRSGREMVDSSSEYGFGGYYHEYCGREKMAEYNKAYIKPGAEGWAAHEMIRMPSDDFSQQMIQGEVSAVEYEQLANGVAVHLFCTTNEPKPHKYISTYTIYDGVPYVELNWGIEAKNADPRPEAGWLAFPMKVADPKFRLARIGGIVDPTVDFVKNTNQDFYFLNTAMAVVDDAGAGVGINTADAPGVSLDTPGLFRFSGEYKPHRPNVFVNLYNNQWGTNFCEWIEGSFSAKVQIWPITDYAAERSLITPMEELRQPIVGVHADGAAGELPVSASGVEVSMKGVLVTAFDADKDGATLRLWEQAGGKGNCQVTLPKGSEYTRAVICDLRNVRSDEVVKVENGVVNVKVEPYKPLTMRLEK